MLKYANGLAWPIIRSSGNQSFWFEGLNLFEASAPFSALRQFDIDAVARVEKLLAETITATARIFGVVPYLNKFKRSDGLFWLPINPDRHLKYWHDGLALTSFPNQRRRLIDSVARLQNSFGIGQDALGRIQVDDAALIESLARLQASSVATQQAIASIARATFKTQQSVARLQAEQAVNLSSLALVRTLPPQDRTARVQRYNRVVLVELQPREILPVSSVVTIDDPARVVYVLRVDRTARVPRP